MNEENKKEYYYELTDNETGESILCSMDVPVKPEKLPEILGLDTYTAKEVSKEYFESESESAE